MVELFTERFNVLAHDELQGQVNDHLDVFALRLVWPQFQKSALLGSLSGLLWVPLMFDWLPSDCLKDFVELAFDVVGVLLKDDVFDELFLGSQDDVPQLREVLLNEVGVVLVFVKELT